jgi:hypothetical protein
LNRSFLRKLEKACRPRLKAEYIGSTHAVGNRLSPDICELRTPFAGQLLPNATGEQALDTRAQGRTPGVSSTIPRARHIR